MRLGIASWSFILIILVLLVVKDGCARKIAEETEADNQLMKAPVLHHDLKQSPTNVKPDDNHHKQHKDKANEDNDDDDDPDHDHDHDHDDDHHHEYDDHDHHHHHHFDHENDHA
ncbi:hypothetical protein PIB30_118886 [Stylosanthes scabra]|uniref:Uncharacterized protein n=1 Tax=Stylosanthes scabra TaxID=79078 RepID=A0ABU6SNZ1_9FABA|nr:hypothetical protein [Stylosanthes scabra]